MSTHLLLSNYLKGSELMKTAVLGPALRNRFLSIH